MVRHFKNLAVFAARLLKCFWPFEMLCIKRLMWVSEKVGATGYFGNYCTKKKLLRNYDSLQVGCSLPRCKKW